MCNTKQTLLPGDKTVERLMLKQQQLSEILFHQLSNNNKAFSAERNAISGEDLKALIRIMGGVPTAPGEFAECCLVGTRSGSGQVRWFCTGVLIHPGVVVTAAHCIKPGRAYVVQLGVNDMKQIGEGELIGVRKVNIHPQYHPQFHLNDIAVMVLQSKAKTLPVPPAPSEIMRQAFEVMLVGFGNDEMTGTSGFGIKRKVEVDILSMRRQPMEDLNEDEMLFEYESDLEFVAGGAGFDTCTGDSGGPVYIMDGDRRWVAGLTSRAVGTSVHPCGDGGIYTRLDVHAPFIQNFI